VESIRIEELLELPEFRVLEVRMAARKVFIELHKADPSALCPRCQGPCTVAKEKERTRRIRDLPILDVS
jgi:transposase